MVWASASWSTLKKARKHSNSLYFFLIGYCEDFKKHEIATLAGNAIALPVIGIALFAVLVNPHAAWWRGAFQEKQSAFSSDIVDGEFAKRKKQLEDLLVDEFRPRAVVQQDLQIIGNKRSLPDKVLIPRVKSRPILPAWPPLADSSSRASSSRGWEQTSQVQSSCSQASCACAMNRSIESNFCLNGCWPSFYIFTPSQPLRRLVRGIACQIVQIGV